MKRVFIKTLAVLLLSLSLSASASAFPLRARALFIGDIMAHKQQLDAAEARGTGGTKTWDFTPQFRRVKPLLKDALIVGNLETTFAGSAKGYAG